MASRSADRIRLCETLRELHLSGMIPAFRDQLDNPRYADLPFEVRFETIINAEADCRLVRRQKRLTQESNMRMANASFGNLDLEAGRGLDPALIEELRSCDWLRSDHHPSVLITGATGTGKTFLAQAFGHEACFQSLSTIYFRMPELLEELDDAVNTKQAARFREKINKKKLLIIDDFGMSAPLSENQSRDLLSLIVGREGIANTLIASQIPIESWHQYIGQPWNADAIIDRLLSNSYRIELEGDSRRVRKAAPAPHKGT